MAGLFEGIPVTAPTGGTSTTELPKWFQDMTYQQMSAAQAVADRPYEQYGLPRVAKATPDQQAAYAGIRQMAGAWQPNIYGAMETNKELQDPTQGFNEATGMVKDAGNASSVDNIDSYMNPYNRNVTDVIAKLGARNLTENILPGVSDSFIRAGQFGSSRMGDIGSRAIRDTNDSILNQQAQVLQSGYGKAVDTAGADLGRKVSAGQAAGSLAGSEALRRQGALSQFADLTGQSQALGAQNAAALESIGTSEQAQEQRELDAAYSNFKEQQDYPKSQLDWFQAHLKGTGQYTPTTTTSTGFTTVPSASPLSQLAAGYSLIRGLKE